MNQWLFDRVNGVARATPWLHPVVSGYAAYGVVVFGVLLLAGWWNARRTGSSPRMAAALCAGAATLVAVAVNQPIVNTVRAARPYTTHSHILVLAHRSADFSFPSDHAVMAGAAAAGLLLVSRRLGVLAVVAALLMAFARVYIAAHYPVDVAAGLVLGAALALACYALGRRLVTRGVVAVSHTRLRPLLTHQPLTSAQR
jgi:membrane-associated phospholipid phosphatase